MDAFIAEIIKALPDAIATAIVTILLTGGILFVFQEKIKNFFARSLFEYQAKFSALHPKRVETLETLYRKLLAVVAIIAALKNEALADGLFQRKIDPENYSRTNDDVERMLEEIGEYFESNRLFLPEDIADQVSDVFRQVGLAQMAIYIVSINPEADMPAIDFLDYDEDMFKETEKNFGRRAAIIDTAYQQVFIQVGILENLYKSVAEAQ